MLGERSHQRGLWEADQCTWIRWGRDTLYGLLASLRGQLFRDADFAELYCPDNGRAQRGAQPAGHGVVVCRPMTG